MRPLGKVKVAVCSQSGAFFGNALLEEELAGDAVDEALHRPGALAELVDGGILDGEVVLGEVELGEARLREEHLARVGEADLAARHLDRRVSFFATADIFATRTANPGELIADEPSRAAVAARAASIASVPELSTLTYEADGRIARITLDRPERGNGITLEMPRELAACVERANLDPAVHVIALAGNGTGFCGGYDLVASAEGKMEGVGVDAAPEGSPLDPHRPGREPRPRAAPGTRWSTSR